MDPETSTHQPSPAGVTTVASSVYRPAPASLNNLAATITVPVRSSPWPGRPGAASGHPAVGHRTTFRRCGGGKADRPGLAPERRLGRGAVTTRPLG